MNRRLLSPVAAVLFLCCAGCIVTTSTYQVKAREADTLRDALASLNREKGALAAENAALARQVAAGKEAEAALSAQVKERDESLKRLSDDLAAARQTYEGGRITREQFINELLEKEKATGNRLQELSARAEGYEKDAERMRREAAARDRELDDLRKKLAALVPGEEQARRERDLLSGRVERLQEERREASARRDERLAALAAELSTVSAEVAVTPMGPALRIVAPEKILLKDRGGKLTETGAAVVSRIAAAVAELPSASLLVIAGGKNSAETFRSAAASEGKIPEGRLSSHVREKDRSAEFLLIAP